MPHAIDLECGNAVSALDVEGRRIVAPVPPALPQTIGVMHSSRSRRAHPFPEQACQPSPPRCCREVEYRTLAPDCLTGSEEPVRSSFYPQTHQHSRFFREFTLRPAVPTDVIGPL